MKIFFVVFAIEIGLINSIIFSSAQYNKDGLGLFIFSVFGLLIVYPLSLITNAVALNISKNNYLYIP